MTISTFEGLREIIAKDYALAPETLSPQTVLKDLAIDSLALIELIFTLEDRFNVTAADASQEFLTLGDVSAYIDRLIAERDESAVRDGPSA